MNRLKNRDKYCGKLSPLFDSIKKMNLNNFIEQLKNHDYFGHHYSHIKVLKSDDFKKCYIFLEMTKERTSCDAMVKLLLSLGYSKAANILDDCNRSPGLINILCASTDTNINVLKRREPKTGSNLFSMTKKPRGLFVIINNVPELLRELQRFVHVFNELDFEIKVFDELNVDRIKSELSLISKNRKFMNDEAFGFMIITHGADEKVHGFEACEEFRKPEYQMNKKLIMNDQTHISELVQIFSDKNNKNNEYLKRIPKVFILDCCRIKEQKSSVEIHSLRTKITESIDLSEKDECLTLNVMEKDQLLVKYHPINRPWMNENVNTYVIYSCSEGYRSWIALGGLTAFGQAFSHAIAEYACEECLESIYNRTCVLMESFKNVVMDRNTGDTAYSAPVLIKQSTGRELHFNPLY